MYSGLNNFHCFIAVFKCYQLLFAPVSFNDVQRKYACKGKILQVIKWVDNV